MDNPVFKLEGVVHERSAEALQDFEGPLDLILFLLSKNKMGPLPGPVRSETASGLHLTLISQKPSGQAGPGLPAENKYSWFPENTLTAFPALIPSISLIIPMSSYPLASFVFS